MQSLLGGADCGPSNPLKQISQREAVDRSLFKDQLAQRHTSSESQGSHVVFRPERPQSALNPQLHTSQTAHPFNLSHLSSALADPQSRSGSASPLPRAFDAHWNNAQAHQQPRGALAPPGLQSGAQWRSQHEHSQAHIPAGAQQSDWANSFQPSLKGKERAFSPSREAPFQSPNQYQVSNGYTAQNPDYGYGQSVIAGSYAPGFSPRYAGAGTAMGMGYHAHAQSAESLVARGAKPDRLDQKQMDELFARAEQDWEASLSKDNQDQDSRERGAEKEEVHVAEAEQQSSSQSQTDDQAEAEEVKEAKGDFEKVWESLKPEAERLGQLAEWERDFSQFTNDEDDLFDVLNDSLNRPDVGQMGLDQQFEGFGRAGSDGMDGMTLDEGLLIREDGIPNLKGYEFPPQANDHKAQSASYLYAQANHILASGGSLSEAASLLESFLQLSTSTDRAQIGVSLTEAWALLGRVHAMDEKEENALGAFQEGRKVLQEEGVKGKEEAAGEMLTSLAISYVNESLDLAALSTLHTFLTLLHPAYAGAAPSASAPILAESTSPWALHSQMKDSFLNLAREQYNKGGEVDADVQVGLGTLFYMMGDYEEARDCWVAALKERPSDYLLWNRLGATLANGGSSEEAVDAYRRALELKPTFTRAISNLGVACMNIGVYREACEHFLAALSLHPSQQTNPADPRISNDSAAIWSTLRKSLIAFNMPDLAEKARPGTDLEYFRKAGFEF